MPARPFLFGELFFGLRRAGVAVGLGEWMVLMRALAEGAVAPDLREFYAVARALLVKDEALFDLWDQVFEAVFAEGEMPAPVSEELLAWLEDPRPPPALSPEELARLEALPLTRLQELFEERLREQEGRHDGGSHWIGTGGTSPFGSGGRNPRGIRVAGAGGGRSAVRLAADRRFRDHRRDRVLDTRSLSVALKKLRRLSRSVGAPELDVEESIDRTCRNAGELELVFLPPRRNEARVLLLMDTGGSMDPHSRLVEQLFSAASGLNHWRKFEAFFFHNCPYATLYRSYTRGERLPTAELIAERPRETFLIMVGDAYMAPDELVSSHGAIEPSARTPTSGLTWLHRLRQHFTHSVWLNPIPPDYTWRSYTTRLIGELFPMYPLTVEGLEGAIERLLGRRQEPPPELDLARLVRARQPWDFGR